MVECKLAEALVVAAVTRSGGQGFGSRVAAGGKKQKPKEPEVSPQARLAASLCLSHWRYGKAAQALTQRTRGISTLCFLVSSYIFKMIFQNGGFLIDTGAAFAVFPHHSSRASLEPLLCGPGGQPVACWGEKPG